MHSSNVAMAALLVVHVVGAPLSACLQQLYAHDPFDSSEGCARWTPAFPASVGLAHRTVRVEDRLVQGPASATSGRLISPFGSVTSTPPRTG